MGLARPSPHAYPQPPSDSRAHPSDPTIRHPHAVAYL